jgi:hypothetical protein
MTTPTKTLKFGIELETAVKRQSFEMGEYHNGQNISKYWTSQTDGSLHSNKCFYCCELVSKTFTYAKKDEVYTDFKNIFKEYNMQDFEINTSMGLHLHFSIVKNRKVIHYYKNIPLELMKKIRTQFIKNIKAKNIKGLEYFKRQYYRDYARKFQNTESPSFRFNQRYDEFNIIEDKGAEWRSFNAMFLRAYENETPEVRLNLLFEWINAGIEAINSVLGTGEPNQYYTYTTKKEIPFTQPSPEAQLIVAKDGIIDFTLKREKDMQEDIEVREFNTNIEAGISGFRERRIEQQYNHDRQIEVEILIPQHSQR